MTKAALRSTATSNTSTAGTQAIDRTLAVLDLFRETQQDLGISDVAHRLDLNGSTVHRMVRALVEREYLAQDDVTERYYLGRAAVLLGHAANEGLGLQRAQTVLDRLRDETAESVNLGTRDGDDMVVLINAEPHQLLRFSQEPGSRLPVNATSMGKAWLAHSESTVEDGVGSINQPLRALTPKTLAAKADLIQNLKQVRKRGYSIDDEEALSGVRCLAAPVLNKESTILAAIAVQAPAVRMSRKRLVALAPLVQAAAEEISHMLPLRQHL